MSSRQRPDSRLEQAMSETRITDLEMLAAHQAQAIDDLSAMVAEQWKVIDAMRKRLDEMSERFQAVEESALGRPENVKPPHW
jgi:SlyX protein